MSHALQVIDPSKLNRVREIIDAEIAEIRIADGLTSFEAHISLLNRLGWRTEFGRTSKGTAVAWMISASEANALVKQVSARLTPEIIAKISADQPRLVDIGDRLLQMLPLTQARQRPAEFASLRAVGARDDLTALIGLCCIAIDEKCDIFVDENAAVPPDILANAFDFEDIKYLTRISAIILEAVPEFGKLFCSHSRAVISLVEEDREKYRGILEFAKQLMEGIGTQCNEMIISIGACLDSADPKWIARVPNGDAEMASCKQWQQRMATDFVRLKDVLNKN